MAAKSFNATIVKDEAACFIPIEFDPRPVSGKIRAPVRVTLNGYTYRSTIASMGGQLCLPLRKSHREAAGLKGDETLASWMWASALLIFQGPGRGAHAGAADEMGRSELHAKARVV